MWFGFFFFTKFVIQYKIKQNKMLEQITSVIIGVSIYNMILKSIGMSILNIILKSEKGKEIKSEVEKSFNERIKEKINNK